MRFDDLEDRLRKYETVNDRHAPEGMYLIARLDGRGFTKLAAELKLQRPFDSSFQEHKNRTCQYLMESSGFEIQMAYHQSDEISLLFKKDTEVFKRNHRKYNSVLASLTSLAFQANLNTVFCEDDFDECPFTSFDCRLIELPSASLVKDYFSWRQQDAARNALNTYCYWKLRNNGLSPKQAHSAYETLSVREKHDLLYMRFATNFAEVPKWQVNGTVLYFEEFVKLGYNPLTKQEVPTIRKRLAVNQEIPFGEEFRNWIEEKFLK